MERALCTSSSTAAFAVVIARAVKAAQMIVLISISPAVRVRDAFCEVPDSVPEPQVPEG
jgi:hypothetical protein